MPCLQALMQSCMADDRTARPQFGAICAQLQQLLAGEGAAATA